LAIPETGFEGPIETMSDSLKIGNYCLRAVVVLEGDRPPYHEESHIFIQHESGEGMSVRENILGEFIARFYRENF
jgi:hypothetical protein